MPVKPASPGRLLLVLVGRWRMAGATGILSPAALIMDDSVFVSIVRSEASIRFGGVRCQTRLKRIGSQVQKLAATSPRRPTVLRSTSDTFSPSPLIPLPPVAPGIAEIVFHLI